MHSFQQKVLNSSNLFLQISRKCSFRTRFVTSNFNFFLKSYPKFAEQFLIQVEWLLDEHEIDVVCRAESWNVLRVREHADRVEHAWTDVRQH